MFVGPLNHLYGIKKDTVFMVETASIMKHLVLLSNKLLSKSKILNLINPFNALFFWFKQILILFFHNVLIKK